MKKFVCTSLILFTLLFNASSIYAQAGFVDCEFGDVGFKTDQIVNDVTKGEDIAVYTGGTHVGKIVVVSTAEGTDDDFGITRFNADGTIDNTFGTGGSVLVDFFGSYDRPNAVAVQDNGKIVVVGSANQPSPIRIEMAIVVLNADGTLDTGFDTDGKKTMHVSSTTDILQAVLFQADGKIVAAGQQRTNGNLHGGDWSYKTMVYRINTNGTLDNTFSGDGMIDLNFNPLTGFLDNAWEGGNSLAQQSDGKILVGGFEGSGTGFWTISRLTTAGALDATFSGDGKLEIDHNATDGSEYLESIAVQSDGKVLLGGRSTNGSNIEVFTIVRLTTAGAFDNTFDTDGKAYYQIADDDSWGKGIAVQSDGKIVLGGWASGSETQNSGNDYAIIRVSSTGALDNTFGTNGVSFFDIQGSSDDRSEAMVVASDGDFLIGGWSGPSDNRDLAIVKVLKDDQPMEYCDTRGVTVTSPVAPGGSGAVFKIEVAVKGTQTPFNITQLNLNTTGTTTVGDVTAAKLYYTGTTDAFSTTTQYGSTVSNPSGAFNFSGSTALSAGTNYFWLEYTISAGATHDDLLDAQVTGATFSGTTGAQTPSITNPPSSSVVQDANQALLYWIDADVTKDVVTRSNLSGLGTSDIVTGLSNASFIAIDLTNQRILWTDNSTGTDHVKRADFDGSNEAVLISGITTPAGIAVDNTNQFIYYADNDAAADGIYRAALNGTGSTKIITTDNVRGIAIDEKNGKIYWVEGSDDEVRRADMNGSNNELFASGLSSGNGIAVDTAAGVVYWCDAGSADLISQKSVSGGAVTTLTSAIDAPRGIDVYDGKVYFTSTGDDIVGVINTNGTGLTTLTSSPLPQGIIVKPSSAAPCTDPTITSVVASPSSGCPSSSRTITVTGTLNDATNWHLYTGSCGGTAVANNATGSFTVSPSATTQYFVRGEGGCVTPGSCTSVTVTVADNTDPVITCPVNQTLVYSSSLSFSAVGANTPMDPSIPTSTYGTATATDNCTASPTITYQDVYSGINSSTCPITYTITRTWTANDGNGNTSNCTQTFTFQDGNAPSVTSTTTTQDVCPGNNTTLSRSASGSAPTYQWQVNTGSGYGNIAGANSATYTIVGATAGMDNNQYRLRATNSCGTVLSGPIILNVQVEALVTVEPTNQSACIGDNLTFTSTAIGEPTPTVQWQVNTGGGFSNVGGGTNPSLTVTNIQLSQDGDQYRAIYSNVCANDTTNVVSITVNQIPSVTTHPTNQTECINTDANFVAAASGIPAPTVQWQVNSGSGWSDVPSATNATLTLTSLTNAQNGNFYRAIFTNTCGADTTDGTAQLTVIPNQTHVVTSTADAGPNTLRDLVALACPGDTIVFDAATNGNDVLLTTGIPLNKTLYIFGNGAQQTVVRQTGTAMIFSTGNSSDVIELRSMRLTDGDNTFGGAISNNAMLSIYDVLIDSCSTDAFGGAIYNNTQGTLAIVRSAVVNNTSDAFGGGIHNQGRMTMDNSTISGNFSTTFGGGIYYNGSSLVITNSTITNNGTSGAFAGGISALDSAFSLQNSIVFGNSANGEPDIENVPTNSSLGNNIIGTVTGGAITPAVGDQFGVDPILDVLADNGGPTPTHALLCGSPAYNAGNNSVAPAIDQRGLPRVVNSIIDIGAYESAIDLTLPTVNVGPDFRTCLYDMLVLDANKGNVNDSVNWYLPDWTLVQADQDTLPFQFFFDTMFVAEVISPDGCISLDTVTITEDLCSKFTADVFEGCPRLVVQFTDTSTGPLPVTSWAWDFGDGQTSTLQNPLHSYATGGFKTVTLIVGDGVDLDTLVNTDYIDVYTPATADFSATNTAGCAPLVTNFTNLSTAGSSGIASYWWNFGDGTTSTATDPSHTYTAAGLYDVMLVVTDSNGCSDTLLENTYVDVFAVPVADFDGTPNGKCNPTLTTSFINLSTGGTPPFTYVWDFGNGQTSNLQSPTTDYTAVGTYDVELIITDVNGCADTAFRNDFANITPLVANFASFQTFGCNFTDIQFTDLSSGAAQTWNWDFGDGTTSTDQSPAHQYTTVGIFDVTLYVSDGNGCFDTIMKTQNIATVGQPPMAGFQCAIVDSCTDPSTVQFTDTTNAPDIATWAWDFGDGNTSSMENPVHTYGATGSYTITLIVTNTTGCSDTVTTANYVNVVKGEADFTSDVVDGCAPLTVNFTDLSNLYGNIVSWEWNFGDGQMSSTQNPSNIYSTAGSYDVTLIVTDDRGCVDTTTFASYINAGGPNLYSLTARLNNTCIDDTLFVFGSSSSGSDFLWRFGDGNTSTADTTIHLYSLSGNYVVDAIVSNSGCADTVPLFNPLVINSPTAQFATNPTVGCALPHTVFFTDQSTLPDTWLWDFGDGNTSTLQNPVHNYVADGTYVVTLTVIDTINGCQDTYMDTVIVNSSVTADFGVDTTFGCGPTAVSFFNNSSNPSGTGLTYSWDFGDGNTSTLRDPIHIFSDPGLYTVTLTVTDDLTGCTDVLTRTNYVQVTGPDVDFDADTTYGCTGLTVNFNDLTAHSNPPVFYEWDFGDGNTSTTFGNVSHTYANGGYYDVSLRVIDLIGCERTVLKQDFIYISNPVASFTAPDLACLSDPVQFTNSSTGDALTYIWNFGDGGVSALENPSKSYAVNGTYIVDLTVTDSNGCESFVQDTLRMYTPPSTAGADDTICVGETANLMASGAQVYQWIGGAGTASFNPSPTSTTTYTVEMYDSLGCFVSDDATVLVNPLPTVTVTNDTICIGDAGTITAGGGTGYSWSNSGGTNASATYSPTTTTTYTVTVTDANGCSATGTGTIVVNPLPVVSTTHDTICINDAGTVTASGGTSYAWSNGGGANASATFSPTTTTVYTVTVTDANGCTATGTATIVVNPLPVTTVVDDTICAGDVGTLTASGGDTYVWTLGGFTTASVNYSPAVTTNYLVTITDTNGCTVVDTGTIVVNIPATPVVVGTTICAGDTGTLSTSGGISYIWDNGSTADTADYSATVTTTYSVTVTDANGCTAVGTGTLTVNPLPVFSAGSDTTICEGSGVQLGFAPPAALLSVVQSENFNACSQPAGWTTRLAAGVDDWTFGPGGFNASFSNLQSIDGTCFAYFDDDGIGGGAAPSTVQLSSPPFDATPYAGLVLDVDVHYNQITAGDYFRIEVWDGTQYVLLREYTSDLSGFDFNSFVHETIDLSGYVNNALQVRFEYNDGGGWSWWGGIDNFALSAFPAGPYSWSPSAGLNNVNVPNPVASPTTSTTYTLTVVDANGCTASDDVVVNVYPAPPAFAGADQTICEGETATLTATGGVSYSWSTGASTASTNVSPLVNTEYIVTVTDGNGCTASDTVEIIVNSLPPVVAGPDTSICDGESVTLIATGADFYTWSTGQLNDSILVAPNDTTDYIVTGTDLNGCSVNDTATVMIRPLPALTIVGLNNNYCDNEPIVNLVGLPAGGVFDGPGVDPTAFTFNPAIVPLGSPLSITYRYTDSTGCANVLTQTVMVREAATASFTGLDASYCVDTMVNVLSGLPAGGAFSGAGISSNTFVSFHAGVGVHPITYTATDTAGCVVSAVQTTEVFANPVINFNLVDSIYCDTDAAVTLQATPAGGTFSGTGVSGASFDPAAAGIGGPYIIMYEYTDTNGCFNSSYQGAAVKGSPAVNFVGVDDEYCVDDAQVVLSGAPAGGSFSGPGVTVDRFLADDAGVGTHTISYTATDLFGCQNTTTMDVEVYGLPNPSFVALDSVYCDNDDIVFLLGAPTGGSFDGPGVTGATFEPASLDGGIYNINYTYTDSNGCVNTVTQTTQVNEAPLINFNIQQQFCLTDNPITVNLFGGTLTGAGVSGNTFDPAVAGVGTHLLIFQLMVDGCLGEAQVTVNVYDCVGIEEQIVGEIRIYPNPFADQFVIELDSKEATTAQVRLMDVVGRAVISREEQLMTGANKLVIAESDPLAAGVYFLEITIGQHSITHKIVKANH